MKKSSSRLRWLRDRHSEALATIAILQTDGSWLQRSDHAFLLAAAMDPTPKALYTQTVVHWLISNAVRFEDARTVRETLSRFDAEKRRLTPDKRDIGAYASPGDLAEAMSALSDPILVDLPQYIVDSCPVHAQGDGWTIFRVEDAASAMWWGDSTQWCTRHQRSADLYLKRGPLHVLTTGTDKWQMHANMGQFMDRYDRPAKDLPGIPDEAVAVLLEIVRSQDRFYEAAVEVLLEDVLKRREASLLPRRPSQMDDRRRCQGARTTPDGRIAGSHDRMHGALLNRAVDGRVEQEKVGKNGLLQELDKQSIVHEMFVLGSDRTQRETAARHARFAKSTYKPVSHGAITQDNEIGILLQWTKSNARDKSLILHDNRRWVAWWHMANIGSSDKARLVLVDVDAPAGSRVHSFMHKTDWKLADGTARRAALAYVEHTRSLPAADAIGFDNVPDALISHWRTPKGRLDVLQAACRPEAALSFCANAIHMAFESQRRSAVLRSVRSVSMFGLDIRTRPESEPASTEDVMALLDVPGSGFLMAGVPDEAIDIDAVDAMIAAGNGEVVAVLPGRLITAERLLRAIESRGRSISSMALANRSMTLSAMDAVDEVDVLLGGKDRTIERLRRSMAEIVFDKGAPIVRQMLVGSMRSGLVPAMPLASTLDEIVEALMAEPRTARALRHRYEGVPPVGRPWRLALEELERTGVGFEEVLASLDSGGWIVRPDHAGSWELGQSRYRDLAGIPGSEMVPGMDQFADDATRTA